MKVLSSFHRKTFTFTFIILENEFCYYKVQLNITCHGMID